jgi:hypothetical protein
VLQLAIVLNMLQGICIQNHHSIRMGGCGSHPANVKAVDAPHPSSPVQSFTLKRKQGLHAHVTTKGTFFKQSCTQPAIAHVNRSACALLAFMLLLMRKESTWQNTGLIPGASESLRQPQQPHSCCYPIPSGCLLLPQLLRLTSGCCSSH